jgi:SAM-dependent methyltransferase
MKFSVPVSVEPQIAARFCRCPRCGSVFDAGFLARAGHSDGGNHGYTPASIRFYVELSDSLTPIAHHLSHILLRQAETPATADCRPCFVDIGCAFGFALALAQMQGWDAIGIEPSEFGEAGRTMLDLDIRHTYLENAGLAPASADAVLLSEVIEHVPDPVNVLKQAVALLRPGGTLLLTTPNADVLVDGSESEVMDTLSPGMHLCIFSSRSIKMLLTQAGVEEFLLRETGGRSGRKGFIVTVGAPPAPHASVDRALWADTLVATYLAHHADNPDVHAYVRNGARFQLAQRALHAQDWQVADLRLAQLMATLDHEALSQAVPREFDAYLATTPAYTGAVYTHTAQRLLAQGNYASARDRYAHAETLCTAEAKAGHFIRADEMLRCQIGQLEAIERMPRSDARQLRHATDAVLARIEASEQWRNLSDSALETYLLGSLSAALRNRNAVRLLRAGLAFVRQSLHGKATRSLRIALRRIRALG